MKKFKVGDKVYCPQFCNDILTLIANTEDNDENYPLVVKYGARELPIKENGFTHFVLDNCPIVFHATDANHALLEKLYGAEFEKPTTPKDIIQALLKHNKYVPCCVSNKCDEVQLAKNFARGVSVLTDFIHTVDNGDYHPYTSIGGTWWRYAVPIDPKTGEIITELPKEDI